MAGDGGERGAAEVKQKERPVVVNGNMIPKYFVRSDGAVISRRSFSGSGRNGRKAGVQERVLKPYDVQDDVRSILGNEIGK